MYWQVLNRLNKLVFEFQDSKTLTCFWHLDKSPKLLYKLTHSVSFHQDNGRASNSFAKSWMCAEVTMSGSLKRTVYLLDYWHLFMSQKEYRELQLFGEIEQPLRNCRKVLDRGGWIIKGISKHLFMLKTMIHFSCNHNPFYSLSFNMQTCDFFFN